MQSILDRVISAFSPIPCVRAIVLGGSRATGTANASSDIDIGIYYEENALDLSALNAAAQALDDERRAGLIGPPGSWGNWVNCGGWLTMGNTQVDLILRDIARVLRCMEETDQGEISMHYQTGHPHAYLNVMYRGELAVSRTLYAADGQFTALKAHAAKYPDALAHALISFFLFEAGFSRDLAIKAYAARDLYALSGQVFRTASALNQVIFALNRTYCINEKRALARIAGLTRKPEKYKARMEELLACPTGENTPDLLDQLLADTEQLLQVTHR